MHKNDQRFLTSLFIFICFLIFLILIKNTSFFKYITIFSIIFFSVSSFFTIFLFGINKKEKNENYIIIQKLVIYLLLYYIFYFLLGIGLGFLKTAYSLNFISILKNTIPVILLIIGEEYFRYQVLRNNNKKSYFIIFTIFFILFEILLSVNMYSLSSSLGILKFIGLLFIPVIAKSFFCSYLSYRVGYKPVIIYRMLLEVIPFILPIIPNLSSYLESILLSTFPMILFLLIDSFLDKYSEKKIKNSIKVYYVIPVFSVLLVLIVLVSGIFKYHMIAIGSNSMLPAITRGDAVIIEKYSMSELSLLNEGNILAFKWDGKIVVHRISSIMFNEFGYSIRTKGDANEEEDIYIVLDNDVVGVVKVKIPFIGLPSVLLSDFFS